MAKVSLDAVKAGMVLAKDLSTDQGRFILSRGTVLDKRSLRVLRIWGVGMVEVETPEGEEPVEPQPVPEEWRQKAREVVEERFRLNDMRHPMLAELGEICSRRLAVRLAAGNTLADGHPGNAGQMGGDIRRELEANLEQLSGQYRTTADQVWSGDDGTLAALPGVLAELVEVINDPRCSALELARVVERDAALTTQLLRLVNSSFYGFPSRIDTISRAVTIIGSRQLTTLAVGMAAVTHFKDIPPNLMVMDTFWRHSLLTGLASRLLASCMNTPNSERFFVAGLLHDMGRVALFRLRPQGAAAALAAARSLGECSHRVERRVFGFDHGVLGGLMFKSWNFPVVLENAVRHHHSPMNSPNLRESAVVHFADVVAHALGDEMSATVLPQVDILAWESLELSTLSLAGMVEQLDFLFQHTVDVFLGQVA